MGIKNSSQNWNVGETVQVGFMKLRVTGFLKGLGENGIGVYQLENQAGNKRYEFTPHYGIARIS